MPCSVVDDLRMAQDAASSAKASLGMNQISVTVVRIVTDGPRPGLGTKTVTQTPVYIGDPSLLYNPTVVTVSSRDVFLSNNKLSDQDVKVGPITRPFSGSCGSGGIDPSTFDVPTLPSNQKQQLYFLLQGPGMESGGSWFRRFNSVEDSAISYTVFLQRTNEKVSLT